MVVSSPFDNFQKFRFSLLVDITLHLQDGLIRLGWLNFLIYCITDDRKEDSSTSEGAALDGLALHDLAVAVG